MNEHEELVEKQQDASTSRPIPANYPSKLHSGGTAHDADVSSMDILPNDVCKLGFLKQQIRKQEYLQIKKSKLQERSNIVLRKVHEVKFRRETESKMLRDSISLKLSLAQRRREAFLESRRQAAQKFSRNSVLHSYCGVTDESSNVGDSEDDLVNWKLSECEEDFATTNDCMYLRSAYCLQRRIKHKLLLCELDNYRHSNLFRTLMFRSTENLQFILSKGSATSKRLSKVLWLLDMPGDYSIFLYGFILMAEFRDTVKYGRHPGYNTNMQPEPKFMYPETSLKYTASKDKSAQLLSIVLFKCAFSVANAFNSLMILDKVVTPFSVEKLRFARLWRNYYFVFEVFRQQHLERILLTSQEVMKLLKEEEQFSEDNDDLYVTILRQRKWLDLESMNLQKYTEKKPSYDWAVRGLKRDLLHQIIDMVNVEEELNAKFNLYLSASQDTLKLLDHGFDINSPHIKLELYPTMHYVEIGKVQTLTYRFPPYLTPNQWRRYLLRYKAGQLLSRSTEELVPQKLKTGYFSIESTRKKQFIETDIEEALKYLKRQTIMEKVGIEIEKICSSSESINLTLIDDCLSTLFLNMFEYCIQFNNLLTGSDYEGITSILASIRNFNPENPLMRIKGKRVLSDLFYLQFKAFERVTRIYPSKLQFVNLMAKQFMATIEAFEDDMEFSNDFVIDILLFYQEAEIMTQNMWLNACTSNLRSVNDIQRFECILAFSGSYYHLVYSSLKSTSTPQLRFPKFYEFLGVYDWNYGSDMLSDLETIYKSSVLLPDFFEASAREENLYDYFRQTFLTYATCGRFGDSKTLNTTFDSNELTKIFHEDYVGLKDYFKEIWIFCVVWAALNSGFGALVVKKGISLLLHIYLLKDMIYAKISTLLRKRELVEKICDHVINVIEESVQGIATLELPFKLMKGYLKSITIGSSEEVSRAILWKLSKIVRNKDISWCKSNGYFKHSFEKLEKFHWRFQDLFEQFYNTYKPLLEWIHLDLGKPVYDLRYCEEIYTRV